MDLINFSLLAQDDSGIGSAAANFVTFSTTHWRFCLLHFLEFSIWGAWFVVLGNFLSARGFSRSADRSLL